MTILPVKFCCTIKGMLISFHVGLGNNLLRAYGISGKTRPTAKPSMREKYGDEGPKNLAGPIAPLKLNKKCYQIPPACMKTV